jgi:hypothetical protein
LDRLGGFRPRRREFVAKSYLVLYQKRPQT